MTTTSPLRGPKGSEWGGFAAAHLLVRRACYGATLRRQGCFRIAMRATCARQPCGLPFYPGDHCGPLGAGRAGRPRPAPAMRAARNPWWRSTW